MRFYLLIFLSFTILGYSQSNTKLVDSLLLETKKDTSYVQLDDTDFIHFSREKIDSINAIKVQGVGISQDSLKRLL